MDDPDHDPPDYRALITAAGAMLAFAIFTWSWLGGGRPW